MSIEFDINDNVAIEAVALFQPDLIVAPFLKRAIPEAVWRERVCLVVHPGIPGDRGPSALDWAIMNNEAEWGVTVLQANAVMDGGDIWATRSFPMRAARKSSLYRNEVTEAATAAVLEAVEKFERGNFKPTPLDHANPAVRGSERPLMKQIERRVDWSREGTALETAGGISESTGVAAPSLQLCRALWTEAVEMLGPKVDNTEIHRFLNEWAPR